MKTVSFVSTEVSSGHFMAVLNILRPSMSDHTRVITSTAI